MNKHITHLKHIAIIGLGKQSFEEIIPMILQTTNCNISAVCDSVEANLELFKQKFNAQENTKTYQDFSQMFEDISSNKI